MYCLVLTLYVNIADVEGLVEWSHCGCEETQDQRRCVPHWLTGELSHRIHKTQVHIYSMHVYIYIYICISYEHNFIILPTAPNLVHAYIQALRNIIRAHGYF